MPPPDAVPNPPEPTPPPDAAARDRIEWWALDKRHIYLPVEITTQNAQAFCARLFYLADKGRGPVTIHALGEGGDTTAAFAMWDAIHELRASGIHVIYRGTGLVASAAAMLLQSADERQLTVNASLLLHDAWQEGDASETAPTLAERSGALTKINEHVAALMAKRVGWTRAKMLNFYTGQERIVPAREAKKLGFIDTIIDPSRQRRGRS